MQTELTGQYHQSPQSFYTDIASLIDQSKRTVQRAVNDAMVMLYWNIGKYLVCTVFEGSKAKYGQKVVKELGVKLTENYGKGFEKTSLFRMIKFYREFPDFQKMATLSQQLTWLHFVILLPIEDESKMSPDLFYRAPYILDFLDLKDTYSEKDLENAIRSEKGNIRVGQYLTKMPSKDVLEQKLLQAIENTKCLFTSDNDSNKGATPC